MLYKVYMRKDCVQGDADLNIRYSRYYLSLRATTVNLMMASE